MKNANIIVLAGQSNAVGVGYTKYLPEHFTPEQVRRYVEGYPNIKINYISQDKRSDGFVPTTLGCTELKKDTVGPEVGIAQWFTEHPIDAPVFIVKCAAGSVSLHSDWCAPSGRMYKKLVCLLKNSIEILEADGYFPEIQAFCWMQGESDAIEEIHAKRYISLYHELLTDFNQIFSAYLHDCVYIDGGISETWPFYRIVNDAKKQYAENHKNCYYIDTIQEGLTVQHEPKEAPDIAHYDSDSVIRLGVLFAEKANYSTNL